MAKIWFTIIVSCVKLGEFYFTSKFDWQIPNHRKVPLEPNYSG